MLNKEEVKKIIPHRDPMLMVDTVQEYVLKKSITCTKYLSPDADFFKGHFPDFPVMPGVLTIEAIAQAGAILLCLDPEFAGRKALFTGMEEIKFKRKILPGETITIKVKLLQNDGRFGMTEGKAYVGDELAASGKIKFYIGKD